jgi:formate dehydrogenase subunit delta
MDVQRLVAMANDIAAFFDAESDKSIAAEGVRTHLTKFWDPRMRREIAAHVAAGGMGLAPTARAAVQLMATSGKST